MEYEDNKQLKRMKDRQWSAGLHPDCLRLRSDWSFRNSWFYANLFLILFSFWSLALATPVCRFPSAHSSTPVIHCDWWPSGPTYCRWSQWCPLRMPGTAHWYYTSTTYYSIRSRTQCSRVGTCWSWRTRWGTWMGWLFYDIVILHYMSVTWV